MVAASGCGRGGGLIYVMVGDTGFGCSPFFRQVGDGSGDSVALYGGEVIVALQQALG